VKRNKKLRVNAPGILGGDTSPSGAALSAILVHGPSHGKLALASNGSFLFTPKRGFRGTDQFTYEASDGTRLSNIATVTLTIGPVRKPRRHVVIHSVTPTVGAAHPQPLSVASWHHGRSSSSHHKPVHPVVAKHGKH
jgi:hypothetical protein